MEIKYTKDAIQPINASKFIPEDRPLPDEIEAIRLMDGAISTGQLYDESAIDWN